MASDFDCNINTHRKWRGTTMSVATTGRWDRTHQRSVRFFFPSFIFFVFLLGFWECTSIHPSLRWGCKGVLWRRVALWLHDTWAIGWLRVINRRRQRDGHDAERLWLKELHCSSYVVFHKFGDLSLCTVVQPLLPRGLVPTAFASFFLRCKKA